MRTTKKAETDNTKIKDLDKNEESGQGEFITTNQDLRINDEQNSLKAGERDATLLEDFQLREKNTHFDHEWGNQVHFMAEFMAILDFPPTTKLNIYSELDKTKASPAELHGEAIFNGKGWCSTYHPAPYYTDNNMHTSRFCF